jgi:hypothetical protein
MTTISIFGIAGPFNDIPGERLEPDTEYQLVDKVTRDPIILPAGNIVTEITARRRADEGDITQDLTPGRSIAVGIEGNARIFTGTPGFITDELNDFDDDGEIPYNHFTKLNPTTTIPRIQTTYHNDKNIVLQSAFGGNVIDGGITIIIKYKPFSESIAKRTNV